MNKVFKNAEQAVEDVFDGATILCGGFGSVGGTPSSLFLALSQRRILGKLDPEAIVTPAVYVDRVVTH